MARIRSKDTSPEIALRRALHALGVRYRVHARVENIKPDIVMASVRMAVFVDGCFWHNCPHHGRIPKSNAPYWTLKLAANALRDKRQSRRLRRAGWRVLRIWEHDCQGLRLAASVRRIMRARLKQMTAHRE